MTTPALPVDWTGEPDGERSADIGGQAITVSRTPDGVLYRRASVRGPVVRHLPGAPGVRFLPALYTETAIAQFESPLALDAGDQRELWLCWPLEVQVVGEGDAGTIDVFRPGLRRTLFGSVTSGRVLPGARTTILQHPGDGMSAEFPWVALRARIENRSGDAAVLPRMPVDGGRLRLFTRGSELACGEVRVRVDHDGDTEAETVPGEAPSGWEVLSGPHRASGEGGLSSIRWRLFTTLLSSEAPD